MIAGDQKAFWAAQRVFLTGHTGFKGGWLSLWLKLLGAEVKALALPPSTDPSLFEAARVGEGLTSVIGDIRDGAALASEIESFSPTILIHMAAQPLVRLSYEQPVETYAINVLGTVHVLEAARRCTTLRCVTVVTSDKCYENMETIWSYRETDRLGGRDPYSNSKACAELVVQSYGPSFFNEGACALISVRAGNVIGGGDWSNDRLLPDLLEAFASERPAPIRRPDAVRPWQHVLEPLSGYLAATRAAVEGRVGRLSAWNFGPEPDSNRTVGEVARLARDAWGGEAALDVHTVTSGPHEAGLLTLDSTKARVHLGWVPAWSLETAIDRTVSWRKAYRAGRDMRSFTEAQIIEYIGTNATW